MMYSNKLAVAIQHKGKILREIGETVLLPFGSEYKIIINNLNTVRALVRVFIDGRDVSEGIPLSLDPKSDLPLERFIKNGNMNAGNRFKFIERSSAVEAHRGVGIEDGLIRVEYQFESPVSYTYTVSDPCWPGHQEWYTKGPIWYGAGGSVTGQAGSIGPSGARGSSVSYNSVGAHCSDVGITAPGSLSNQQFQYASSFALEPIQHVLILKLAGQVRDNNNARRITQPVTVKTMITCGQCGKKEPPSAKYCSRCGSSVQLV